MSFKACCILKLEMMRMFGLGAANASAGRKRRSVQRRSRLRVEAAACQKDAKIVFQNMPGLRSARSGVVKSEAFDDRRLGLFLTYGGLMKRSSTSISPKPPQK